MRPLLTIETVPISIEYKYKSTAADPVAQSAKLRISTADTGVTIKSNPISIRMDSFNANESEAGGSKQYSSPDLSFSYDATARYADGGSLQMDIRLMGSPIEGLDFQRVERSIENVMGTIASTISDLPSAGRDMRINFQIGGLSLDSGAFSKSDISFIPGDLEFEVKEYPKVIIKYIGGPIYIPKSSDPDYVAPEQFDVVV